MLAMASASRNPPGVAQGGMFNMPKAKFSRETQELLKVMMDESKLTNFQQRQLKKNLKSGQSLPLHCHPTTSSKPERSQPARSSKKSRRASGGKQGLRPKETIDKITELSEENFVPRPVGRNSTKEKTKLQNMMTFGTEDAPIVPKPSVRTELEEEVDRFEEVLGEIEERRQFLDDMASLGQDRPHRDRIMTEISQRIRELEEIDRKKCTELKITD